MSCEHVSLELRPKTSETVSSAYKRGKAVLNGGAQHENRRAAMFVDEDGVDSRSDVDDLRTRDYLYDESLLVSKLACSGLSYTEGLGSWFTPYLLAYLLS